MACPYRPPSEMSPRAIEGLRAKYRQWDALGLLIWLVCGIGLSVAWYLGLRQLAAWSARDLGQSRYLILPSGIFWAIPTIFLGIVSPWLLIHWPFKALLRGRFEEWLMWGNLQAGFDCWKLVRGSESR